VTQVSPSPHANPMLQPGRMRGRHRLERRAHAFPGQFQPVQRRRWPSWSRISTASSRGRLPRVFRRDRRRDLRIRLRPGDSVHGHGIPDSVAGTRGKERPRTRSWPTSLAEPGMLTSAPRISHQDRPGPAPPGARHTKADAPSPNRKSLQFRDCQPGQAKTGLACAGRGAERSSEHLARWHRFSAPTS
jgi:hypothetical protein